MRFPATVLFAMALTAQAHAYPTLSYDSPVIEAAPAEVIPITADLTLGLSDGVMTSDGAGVTMIDVNYSFTDSGFCACVQWWIVMRDFTFAPDPIVVSADFLPGVFQGSTGGLTIAVVPEPASAMLMLTGLAALVTSRRKR